VLVPAQIRALRLKSENPPMPFQRDLAREAELHQSRISVFETPGAANITLETLSKIAAGLRVGVIVKFVPFHDMLRWENSFSPDTFDVERLDHDDAFLNPAAASFVEDSLRLGSARPVGNESASVLAITNAAGSWAREELNQQRASDAEAIGA
jgi:DNA-binding Xre family transcriptional regulator